MADSFSKKKTLRKNSKTKEKAQRREGVKRTTTKEKN